MRKAMQLMRRNEQQQQPSIWDNVFSIDNGMERMLGDFWKPFGALSRMDRWMPRVDVTEDKEAFHITADIPGVDPKDVTVEVVGDALQLHGRSEHERREERGNWIRMERQAGEFSRSFNLPANVDTDRISAQTKHGVIEITIPKKPEAQQEAKRIQVRATEDSKEQVNSKERPGE